MASSGEKFLKGLISAQRGISAAYVNDLIENDRRKEEERELERQAKIDRLNEQNVLSQIKSREQEEPEEPSIPKMSFETPGGIKISGEENEKMQAALEKYGVKKPEDREDKRPTNVTGAPSYGKVVSDRTEETKAAQAAWDKKVAKIQGAIQEVLGDRAVEDVIDLEDLNDEERQAVGILQNMYSQLGERPADYDLPTGERASALQDSTEVARKDSNVLSALLSYEPGKRAEDPEIAKARKKLESGEWDQAKFDRFMEWYNAEKY